MLSLSACKRFWSNFRIVSFVSFWIPFGKYSSRFCDKWRSVRLSSPPISSGISSSRFSDTSRQTKFRRFPMAAGSRCSWLWSNQSSWSDGKLPRCGGSSSISLSPKSKRSSFVSLLMDSGRCFSRFSRSSSDSNDTKLREGRRNRLKSAPSCTKQIQSTWKPQASIQLSLIKEKDVTGGWGSKSITFTPYHHRNTHQTFTRITRQQTFRGFKASSRGRTYVAR